MREASCFDFLTRQCWKDSRCLTPTFTVQLSVRLDLFLKTSRLIKRRAIAREMCDAGRVLVNGHESKPAKEVRQGDIITLKFSSRIMKIDVLGTPASAKKASSEDVYKVRSERRLPKEEDLWNENLS
jgi:ribosomal 50S subunit-recycling heat shock protein